MFTLFSTFYYSQVLGVLMNSKKKHQGGKKESVGDESASSIFDEIVKNSPLFNNVKIFFDILLNLYYMSNDRMEISAIFCCTPKYHCGATVRVAGGVGMLEGCVLTTFFMYASIPSGMAACRLADVENLYVLEKCLKQPKKAIFEVFRASRRTQSRWGRPTGPVSNSGPPGGPVEPITTGFCFVLIK